MADRVWVQADFHCPVLHYRMPDTVAISSFNPAVPSPATVQMAMVAGYMRVGEVDAARRLARALNGAELLIEAPECAVVFRAFLRYVRPPASPKKGETGPKLDSGTGGRYTISPHYREYAVLGMISEGSLANLRVAVRVPADAQEITATAFRRIEYLGAKDSLVACLDVQVSRDAPEVVPAMPVRPEQGYDLAGAVVRLSEVRSWPDDPGEWIPGSRPRNMIDVVPYVLPGRFLARGTSRIFMREQASDRRQLDIHHG